MPRWPTAQDKRDQRDAYRDIGEAPQCVHPEERAAAESDMAAWLKRYFADVYPLPWADHHREAMTRLSYSLGNPGYFAFAMPRGDGKTAIVEGGTIYGILTGKQDYIILIGQTQAKARELLDDIKFLLFHTPLLYQDYPEWVHAVRATEQSAQRANNLRHNGQPLVMEWKQDRIIIPNLATGDVAIIESHGITGAVRGAHYVTPDGRIIRPRLAIPDDPQTQKSASSASQIEYRLRILRQDVAKLCGPDQEMAIFMPCTIIRTGDVADTLLNNDPNWHGQITKALPVMPDNLDLWEDYNAVRIIGEDQMDGGAAANAWYTKHRDALEAGAVVSWDARVKGNDITALQSTMNEYFKNGAESFWAECQNEPLDQHVSVYEITPEIVKSSLSGVPRHTVPEGCDILTAFIDINYSGLHYAVIAWRNDEAGYIVDHGKWPERLTDVLYDPDKPRGLTEGQAIFQGLHQLCSRLCVDTDYKRDGERAAIDLLAIDAGAKWYETVFNFVRHAAYGTTKIQASVGRAASKYRMTGVIGRPGDNIHQTKWRKGRVILHNADYYRMATQKAFLCEPHAPGSLNLYGSEPHTHEYLAAHVCNEKLIQYLHGDVHDIYTWFLKPGESNDMLDAITGAKALASLAGISSTAGRGARGKAKRRRLPVTVGNMGA